MDVENLASRIKKRGAKKVLLQVPEGLKMKAIDNDIVSGLEKHGIKALLSAEPCYGACDLRDSEAKDLGCKLLVHIGHSDMGIKTEVPVLYNEYRIPLDPVPLLKRHAPSLKPYRKICLVTTLQFIEALEPAKKYLQSAQGGRKKVFIGQPNRAKYPGQVLGCDFSAAEPFERLVDSFLFIGSGVFHPLGLAMKVGKPVLFLDIETRKLRDMGNEKRRQEIIHAAKVHKASESRNFGVLVSTKQGQMHAAEAEKSKKMLESKGKGACILVMDEISPNKLMGLQLDCLVNCACPRLSDDSAMFRKPIINPEDIGRL